MKKNNYYLLLIFIILFGCTNAKQESSSFQKDEWMINSQGVGKIKLGESIQDIRPVLIKEFEVLNSKYGGFNIIENDDVLIDVSPITKDIVGVIEIYSEKFETKKGLKVGMSIEEIELTYSDFLAQMDIMNGNVYFSPPELQSSNSIALVYFTMLDNSPVWDFEKSPNGNNFTFEPKGEVNKKAIVEFIRIYNK